MAAAKGKKLRGVLRLRGGQVDLAIGVLAAALLEVRSASAEDIKFDGLSRLGDPKLADQVNGLLREAVATNDIKTMSLEELKTLLSPEHLADLGIDAKEFAELLQHDPKAAIAKLEAAFAHKLHLASFESAHKAVATFAADDAGGGSAAAGAGSESMLTPALIIGGVIAGGVGVGFLVGNSGGGSSSGSQGGQSVNSPPLAITETVTTNEDTPITFDPRTNDTDANGDALTITAINGTAITATTPVTVAGVGSFALNANGTLTFTPAANFNGSPTFTYTVADPSGATSTVTDTVNVTAVNDAPVAVNDAVTTAEDTPITFDPRTNDTDVDGPSKIITQINGTAITATAPVTVTGGVVSLNANGTLTFTPNANFNGTPTFTYTLSDGAGGTSTATVNLTITPVNDAPVNAVPASISGSQSATIAIKGITVSDVDSTSLTTTLHVSAGLLTYVTVAGGATVTGSGTDTLVFSGTAAQINAALNSINFNGGPALFGTQTLTVTTSDGLLTDTDTINLTIGQVATQTIALSDGYIEGATVFIDVNGDGIYEDGEPKGFSDGTGHYVIVGNGTGTLIAFGGTNLDTGLPNNLVLMAPAGASAVNPLTTVLTALISGGMSSADAMAALIKSLGLPPGTDLLHLDILSPDTDPALQLAAQKAAVEIALTLDAVVKGGGDQGALLAKLANAYSSGDPVDLTNPDTLSSLFAGVGLSDADISKIALQTASSNHSVDVATSLGDVSQAQGDAGDPNHDFAPVAADDTVATAEDTPITFDPRANDADPEGKSLTITAINGTAIDFTHPVTVPGGVISLNADGSLTYTPTANFNGSLPAIAYTVVDPAGNATDGSITLTVAPVNDAPVANADAASAAFQAPVTIDVLANDTDVDGDKLTIFTVNNTAISVGHPVSVTGGSVSLVDGKLVFTPSFTFVGTSSFTYSASDGTATASGQVSVSVAPSTGTLGVSAATIATVVVNASALAADGVQHLDVIGTDPNGDPLTITDAQASALANAGIDFVVSDDITVEETSQKASVTLKQLEGLNVDNVAVKAVGGVSIDAGSGGLGGLTAGSLPTFTGATGEAVDVTLNIGSGTLDPALNLGTLVPALGAAGIDHVNVTGDGHLSVSLDQAESFVGSGVDFVAGNDITLNVASGQIGVVTGSASGLGTAHIDHIDVTDNSVTIDDGQATSLINAGLDFVTSDNVTVEVAGTHTSTTLKGLQDLHVDNVAVKAVGGLSIDAGSGGLGGLSAGGVPQFVTDGGATAHVTLDIASGTLGSDVSLGDLAPALHSAGIDHIDVTGSGDFTLSAGQALDIAHAGVDFVASDNITITTGADQIAAVVGGASALGAAHIDHIDVTGDHITLDDSQASSLVSAGLDFVTGDDVTVSVDGTHLSTSLKGLQDLHVDSVAVKNVSFVSIDAGSGPLSADNLPSFTIAQSDAALDVTLTINDGTLPASTDIFHLAPALGAAGIDHIGVSGDGHLTLSAEQALDFVHSGVDFASAADITVSLTAANLPAAIGSAGELASLNVDHLDVSGHVVLDDTQAATLIGDGLDFATADDITVQAHGTHLSTSLGGLQALHVDTVVGDGIHNIIKLDAGDFSLDSALPQFASGLDVTLDTHSTDFLNGDIASLTDSANKLLAAGIDHIGIEQPLDTLTADQLATIAQIQHDTGLNFVYDPTPAAATPDFGSLVSLLEGVQPVEPTVAGVVAVSDAATASLIQSGALQSFLGETLVVDATDSGDKMLTSLKSLGDLGVDSVLLPHGDAPVYVDLGFGTATPTTAELTQLLNTVDPAGAHEPLFSGATHVGLVVDQASLDALAGVSGSLTHLADLGFTEIDVLDGTKVPDALANDPHVEIKIIGPDGDTAELYDHLHHQ
ncbi:hypothetical protein SAMN05444678_11563 [Sphingomonas sp. YR710]|uniref:beta strand repeat-containing protein n=1 Tax=Sphingomonas sp. YR710 TaxID=1882773 RepID=UPI0008916AC8|nr:cadherin-like domain-containing protein [Sphingomonas sp. YR710]SDD53957.1 hypothetical protein SAMN05444678_11563 [Sphingomonas sp. YR710]